MRWPTHIFIFCIWHWVINASQNAHETYPGQTGLNYDYSSFELNQTARAEAVIEMFRFAWSGYYTYAFPNDELLPRNNSFSNRFNGWGVTAIDALDTAIIMEQEDIVNAILRYVPTIGFTRTKTDKPLSLFETNIRYMGGLLSAYDLLKGPFSHLNVQEAEVDTLLSQCVVLANSLKPCFDTRTGIPSNDLYLNNPNFASTIKNGTRYAGLAQFGTLVLEWQHLSDLTGDPSYGALAQRAQSYWMSPSSEVWPGLTGSVFSIETGEILNSHGGWTSGNDSAYEYLIKMYVYDPERYANYSARFIEAADSTIAHLLSHPATRPDLTMVGTFDGTTIQNYTDQLACFIGGTFILGGTALHRSDYLNHGLQFCEFCANGYRYAASGIGPTAYSWSLTDLDRLQRGGSSQASDATTHFTKAGWFVDDVSDPGSLHNGQTPEALESWYYAYQVTGNQYWRDVAWAYCLAQNRSVRVKSGFTNVGNVLLENGGGRDNWMKSYMLSETLKYQYLIQAPEERKGFWDVAFAPEGVGKGGNINLFVYNTEGHPLRVRAKRPV